MSYSLPTAEIDWLENNIPSSRRFGDIYFPPDSPIDSSIHTFITGNGLSERWDAISNTCNDPFVIGEVGFGTGLNFLLTLELWRRKSSHTKWLYYISAEKHPFSMGDLKRSLSCFSTLTEPAHLLLSQYPPPLAGHHRLLFKNERIVLDLLLGDALAVFQQHQFIADAWYLDGFSPAQNSDLWSEELFSELARHSRQGTTFATFSAAGWVRRNLEKVGFEVTKSPGFPPKKEAAIGTYVGTDTLFPKKPVQTVGIIGAGLAGVSLAYHLSLRGCKVLILEEESEHSRGASGNSQGVILPYITAKPSLQSELYLTSYLYTLRFLKNHCNADDILLAPHGVIHFPSTSRLQKLLSCFSSLKLPHEIAYSLTQEEVSRELHTTASSGAFCYPMACSVSPRDLVKTLLHEAQQSATTFFPNHEVTTVEQNVDGRICIACSGNRALFECDAVVFANAYKAKQFSVSQFLPIEPVRGQIIRMQHNTVTASMNRILCYDGYMLPAHEGSHLIGATFQHNNSDITPSEADTYDLLARIPKWLPEFSSAIQNVIHTRVGFRTSTKDRIPVVGNLQPLHSNVYCLTGFGSRGLTSIIPAADLLASQITDHPLPFPHRLHQMLRPMRFSKGTEKI
ncbi:MAG: FAD-dependent 5-carboxymethylaminomethyl-2-thiouridine(34) oxidoreductase MnmC [Bdellovibrionales bacterium]|nr:FAD-dependent 5-carboxymethylaminomethyl-2-thiouridine(34) oxidoreductase MnmC [Bdellovibrionales bacterium]